MSESEPEPEPESKSKSHRQQELRETGTTFTSEEIDAMSREDLVRNLKALQQGRISDKVEEESRDRTSADQPQTSNTSTPVNLSEQERRHAVVTHTRNSFCVITDMKDGNSVCPTIKDADGVIQYWTMNEHGIKILTPAWEEWYQANLKVWKGRFLSSKVGWQAEGFHLGRNQIEQARWTEILADQASYQVEIHLSWCWG
ncbi:hypothetical protein RSAG8_11191, partial [Rhizoctonia solani AG-8 WAC10335]